MSYAGNMVLASAVTLTPTADAFVHSGSNANTNFGAAINLITKTTPDNGWKRETLLRFDMSQFTFAVGSAKLRIFGGLSDRNNASIRVDVKEIPTNSWLESTLTWNNKPAHLAPVLAFQTVVGITKIYYEWDLTSYIIDQKAAGKTVINLKLINPLNSASRIDFNSKEAVSNKPQLFISPSTSSARVAENKSLEPDQCVLESILIYPNPAKDALYIDLNELVGFADIKVLDISGKQLISKEIIADKILDLDIRDLKQGVYFLHIQTEDGKITRRFVVE